MAPITLGRYARFAVTACVSPGRAHNEAHPFQFHLRCPLIGFSNAVFFEATQQIARA